MKILSEIYITEEYKYRNSNNMNTHTPSICKDQNNDQRRHDNGTILEHISCKALELRITKTHGNRHMV